MSKYIKLNAHIEEGVFVEVADIPMECIGHEWVRTPQGSWVKLAVLQ